MAARRILFVCLGNICRSPAAEGAFKHVVGKSGLAAEFKVDSCGTAAYHTGEPPNARTQKVARAHGITLNHRARQFQSSDFKEFDLILAMDKSNYQDLVSQARTAEERARVQMYRSYDPESRGEAPDVPDPYHGGLDGFEDVQEIMNRTSEALLKHLTEQ